MYDSLAFISQAWGNRHTPSQTRISDGIRVQIRVFRRVTDMPLITGRAYSTIGRQRYRRNNAANQENG